MTYEIKRQHQNRVKVNNIKLIGHGQRKVKRKFGVNNESP